MKEKRKSLWRRLGILLAGLGLLALAGPNLALQSGPVKRRIVNAVTKASGAPATVGFTYFLPFHVLTMRNVEIANEPELTPIPFFRARSCVARIRLRSLLQGRIVIENLAFHNAEIVTVQDRDGRLARPGRRESPPMQPPIGLPFNPAAPQVTGPVTPPTAQPPKIAPGSPPPGDAESGSGTAAKPSSPASQGHTKRRFSVLLHAISVNNSSVKVLLPGGKGTLLHAQGLSMDIDISGALKAMTKNESGSVGHLRLAEGRLLQFVHIRNVRSPITIEGDRLIFSGLEGDAHGGKIRAEFSVFLTRNGTPFTFKGELQGLELPKLAKKNALPDLVPSGKLNARLELVGYAQLPATLRGGGSLEADNIVLHPETLVKRVFDDGPLEVETCRARFSIRGPQVFIEDFLVSTEPATIRGLGTVAFQQDLNLSARLYVSDGIRRVLDRIERRLPGARSPVYSQLEGRDGSFRDFLLAGTLASPTTNFFGSEKPLAGSVEEIRLILSQEEENRPAREDNPDAPSAPMERELAPPNRGT